MPALARSDADWACTPPKGYWRARGMAERFARSEVGRGRIGDEFHAAQATGDQGGVAKITAANDTVDVFACQVCGAVAGIYFDLDVEVVGVERCQCRYHQVRGNGRAHVATTQPAFGGAGCGLHYGRNAECGWWAEQLSSECGTLWWTCALTGHLLLFIQLMSNEPARRLRGLDQPFTRHSVTRRRR